MAESKALPSYSKKKTPKSEIEEKRNTKFFATDVLILAKRLGFTLEELEEITYPMFFKLALRKKFLQNQKPIEEGEEFIRKATQKDFDNL